MSPKRVSRLRVEFRPGVAKARVERNRNVAEQLGQAQIKNLSSQDVDNE